MADENKPHSDKGRLRRMEVDAGDARVDAVALGRLLSERGIDLCGAQLDLLARFHNLLVERNKTHNLTRIWGLHDIVLKHYVDSLLVLRFLPELPSPLLDLGSGAGFPGIPLKIASSGTELLLAEAQQKKAEFLREACAALALPGLGVIGRSVDKGLDVPVQGVISRAVERIRETLRQVRPFLPPGALVIFMKGPSVDEEKQQAARGLGDAFVEVADHAYALPGTEMGRRLVVYGKR